MSSSVDKILPPKNTLGIIEERTNHLIGCYIKYKIINREGLKSCLSFTLKCKANFLKIITTPSYLNILA